MLMEDGQVARRLLQSIEDCKPVLEKPGLCLLAGVDEQVERHGQESVQAERIGQRHSAVEPESRWRRERLGVQDAVGLRIEKGHAWPSPAASSRM